MRLKAAILSLSIITVMGGATITPALGQINAAFPDAGETLVKLIATMHALFIIPFTLISSRLTKYFSKKTIIIPAVCLYIIAGLSGGAANNIIMLLTSRALLGISIGLIMPISTSIVADFFEGREKMSLMGKLGAANTIGGSTSLLIAGMLAGISWRLAFVAYGIAVVTLVLNLLYVPVQKPAKKEEDVQISPIPGKIFLLGICMFLLFIINYSIPTNIAIYLETNHLGGSTVSGIVIAVGMLGSAAVGIVLVKIRDLTGRYFIPVQLALVGIGFSLVGFTSNAVLIGMGSLLRGLGFGGIFPQILNHVSDITSGNQTMTGMAIVQSFLFLGQFSSPIVLDAISNLIGNGTNRFSYQFIAVTITAAAVILLIKTVLIRVRQKAFCSEK